MKKIVLILTVTFLVPYYIHAQRKNSADSVLTIMKKVADWQLETWKIQGMNVPKWDWTLGACYAGFMALHRVAKDTGYLHAMYRIGKELSWNTGPRRTMADDYCVAQLFSQLYLIYRDPTMIAPFRILADSIAALSHEESLEWRNNVHMREWAWCDALFMGPPALAYLATATGNKKYLHLADTLWWKTTDYLYDSVEHLYSRDSRYFNAKEANGNKMFWARGNGWVLAGLSRVLDNMPPNYPNRSRFIKLYKNMAAKIASLQHADGSWHTALLDSVSYPIKETSGTGFYCFALTWGINKGLLNYEDYYPVVAKAWLALTSAVHPDGELGYVQRIGEKPGNVDYESTQVYGVGACLLAGSEMIDLIIKHPVNKRIYKKGNMKLIAR